MRRGFDPLIQAESLTRTQPELVPPLRRKESFIWEHSAACDCLICISSFVHLKWTKGLIYSFFLKLWGNCFLFRYKHLFLFFLLTKQSRKTFWWIIFSWLFIQISVKILQLFKANVVSETFLDTLNRSTSPDGDGLLLSVIVLLRTRYWTLRQNDWDIFSQKLNIRKEDFCLVKYSWFLLQTFGNFSCVCLRNVWRTDF